MEHEITSRAEAKSLGLKYYFTGKPCRNGETAQRTVSSKNCCCDKCQADRLEYRRLWNEQNRETVRGYDRKWREGNRDACREKDRLSYKENRESRLEYSKRYYRENREAVLESTVRSREKNREAYLERKRQYRQENLESELERNRQYRADNPEKMLAAYAKRRAAKRQAVPSWFGEFDQFVLEEAYELSKLREVETGIKWNVDHMIPLLARKACGLHCASNIQVIPEKMNFEKKNRMVLIHHLEWLR